MSIEVKVPVLPEAISAATVAQWYKSVGEQVSRDENLLDLETDKVMLEVTAPADGVIEKIMYKEGSTVTANEVVALIKEGAPAKPAAPAVKVEPAKEQAISTASVDLSPAVRRLVQENDVDLSQLTGSGKSGRIVKQDVESYLQSHKTKAPAKQAPAVKSLGPRSEERVPMTRMRARIAERLLESKNSTAMLTTFNEVNMQPIMDLRAEYRDRFEKQHGVRLGFMSFFVKTVIEALKQYPIINASIDGTDVVYHGYFDMGIAVSTERGLVVPILRDADQMSMAEIERQIIDCATRARAGKLTLEEMTGGTFTISNGGIFGSMLSTPILNPPQSGILGMHNIVKRPVVENDEIVIRPMMYLAFSYDHRIIDAKDSVTFLVTIKQFLEDPTRILLEV